jgi:hypothetical protein
LCGRIVALLTYATGNGSPTFTSFGKGVAKALTAKLALKILNIGVVPFSGNRWANIHSLKTQLSCGFKSAWVEMTTGAVDTVNIISQ